MMPVNAERPVVDQACGPNLFRGDDSVTQVTQILAQIEAGDANASDELLVLLYDELRKLAASKLAREKPGQTLQATALVHEAYLRLVGTGPDVHWDGSGHFFAAAAEAMRRVLVNRALRKQSRKHGGNWARVDLSERDRITCTTPDQLVAIDDALDRLAVDQPEATELVKLRLFAGLSVQQAGTILNMSRATAYRHWTYARAWLKTQMLDGD